MKIAIIGAAGVRTPLIIQAILERQDRLELSELSLMDIDGVRLDLIGSLSHSIEISPTTKFHITRTTEPHQALNKADFVITTFRVGGIESRVIDEQVPLRYGILGQETTGAGGFAMGMRSIPVILNYIKLMEEVCPEAWLINFANPAGMLTEAVIRNTTWRKVVGICDTPSSMVSRLSNMLGIDPTEVLPEYFGLNHLGWLRGLAHRNQAQMPQILEQIKTGGSIPGIPIDAGLINRLGVIPNEYLYYYYYTKQAINNILAAGECRGEQVARQNQRLLIELQGKAHILDFEGMQATYQTYLEERGNTYMVTETGMVHPNNPRNSYTVSFLADEGYAGVALDLMEALIGNTARIRILNVPNAGAVQKMEAMDVVEIPTQVSKDNIQPLKISEVPEHCLGLMMHVKHYERMTIEAAVESSYLKARLALASHPLVGDDVLAGNILDEYITRHRGNFPSLH